MKVVYQSIFFIISMFLISCSSDESKNENNLEDENPTEEPIKVLNLVNIEKIADTPVSIFRSHIVHNNKLFSVSYNDTYVFDFELATWTLLDTNTENVFLNYRFGDPVVNFIRNGDWHMFTESGLFVFDFELSKWSVVKAFPQTNGLFSTAGFYIEEDMAVYFVDNSNGNDTIYKFDLLTNELLMHGEYVNEYFSGNTYNGSLVLSNSYYHVKPRSQGIIISKFNEDFTDLSLINDFDTKTYLINSIAISFENYIIFGLGGSATQDANGNITKDDSTLKFYAYDTVNDSFAEMPSQFYESCRGAEVVMYNNEFYLINGSTIKNQKSEYRNIIEKLEFDFITP